MSAAFDYRWLRTFSWLLYLINIGLLLLTMAIGTEINGAQRWISVAGLTFQFSEISKVLMIAVLAAFLAGRADRINRVGTLDRRGAADRSAIHPDHDSARPGHGPRARRDHGRSALPGWREPALDGRRRGRRHRCAADRVVGAAGVPEDRASSRFSTRPRIRAAPASRSTQAQIAVGSGGIFGKGLTAGAASGLLPVQSTDFAFAVLLEELGFIGGVVVFLLFIGLIWRVLVIGWRSESVFGVAFAGGAAAMVIFQMLVNAGMVAGIDARDRHPAAIRHARRRFAGEHRDRARSASEHQYQACPLFALTGLGTFGRLSAARASG